jgi:hypothetical protein
MQIRNLLCTIMLVLLTPLMVNSVRAQTTLVADIPFAFTACHEQLPGGKYKVERLSGTNSNLLLVRGEDSRSSEIICTRDVQATRRSGTAKLIFNRYGDQYFLSEIWLAGRIIGNELVKSEREEALIKELPARKKRERVTIRITEAKPN